MTEDVQTVPLPKSGTRLDIPTKQAHLPATFAGFARNARLKRCLITPATDNFPFFPDARGMRATLRGSACAFRMRGRRIRILNQ
jgi:hypothetical protein